MSDAAAAATAAATAAAAAAAAAAGAAGAGAAGVAGARAVGAGAGAGAGEQELPGAGAGEQEQELLQHVATETISGARAHDTVVGGEPSQKLADNDISMGVLAVAGHHGGNFHDLDSNACRARRSVITYAYDT